MPRDVPFGYLNIFTSYVNVGFFQAAVVCMDGSALLSHVPILRCAAENGYPDFDGRTNIAWEQGHPPSAKCVRILPTAEQVVPVALIAAKILANKAVHNSAATRFDHRPKVVRSRFASFV